MGGPSKPACAAAARQAAKAGKWIGKKASSAWRWLSGGRLAPAERVLGKSYGGPGQYVRSGGGPKGMPYQEQVTGIARGVEYQVLVQRGGQTKAVRFDGYARAFAAGRGGYVPGRFMDAKDWGPGFQRLLAKGGSVAKDKLAQAKAQIEAAAGKRIDWVISDQATADWVRKWLQDNGLKGITVVFKAKK